MRRFKVGSVTGYSDGNRRKQASVWYVHDSANCFHIMESFSGGWRVGGRVVLAEERAWRLALELEEAYP